MKRDIHEVYREREIPYLLHFTRPENLESILEIGLQPRANIDLGVVPHASVNDASRHDGRRDRNRLSISFPNYKMFFPLRSSNPGIEWPVLVIDPKVLWTMDCLFCCNNAASNNISSKPDHELSTADTFKNIFIEPQGSNLRTNEGLKPCDPTDVQSEVLVKGVISPDLIYAVVFQSEIERRKYLPYCGRRSTHVQNERGFYGKREYYRKWGLGKD